MKVHATIIISIVDGEGRLWGDTVQVSTVEADEKPVDRLWEKAAELVGERTGELLKKVAAQ